MNIYINTLRQKGQLAYEYNPFHNFQTNVDLIKKDNFIFPKGSAINKKNGEILTKINGQYIDKRNRVIKEDILDSSDDSFESENYANAGSLIDFDTEQLNFDLKHPVDIEIQPSYDGSVNLILNDDKNLPRLINSRFSVREKNTYEIVDRIGENDTNIYSSNTFDKDTSLYFHYEINPKIEYKGFIKGILPVGQYCFYFTYCDADDNESDYIAESGLIPVFIGNDRDPKSIDGGIKNQQTNKGIKLKLSNLDSSYSYIKVYYVRYFADYQQNRVYECKKIYRKYPLNSSILNLQITGNEDAEDLDANILNITRFNPNHILAQAQCKNMLFFGNIVKNADNYKELSDCALRIIPSLVTETDSEFNQNYQLGSYYDSIKMYNKVGYFPEEFYRFGVVFIYNNGTLSNVYNTLGLELDGSTVTVNEETYPIKKITDNIVKRNYIKSDDQGWIDIDQYSGGAYLNSKGVCKINVTDYDVNTIYGVKFTVTNEIKEHLTSLGIRGMFFVRQKCVPNILGQTYILPMDKTLEGPILKENNNYYTECFLNQENQKVMNYYDSRLYKYKYPPNDSETFISKHGYAGICPDFLLNQPYYNQIFNGGTFKLQKIANAPLTKNGRFYTTSYSNSRKDQYIESTICTVTEDVPTVALKDEVFKLEMGSAEESFRFKWAEIDNGTYDFGNDNSKGENKDKETVNGAKNLVRGVYSPYLAIYSTEQLEPGCIYNILIDNIQDQKQEYQNRMNSNDAFYAISDRLNFSSINTSVTCWRGDCYLNTFTYRLNRNFNDPTLPNNDVIIQPNTWKDNYDAFDESNWTNISRSDLNAVQMGSWITFPVRSSINYALRSQDHSFVSEEALMGSPRSYYPRTEMMWKGTFKMPDSYLYNDAYRASLGFKCYFTLDNVNYIKNTFSNRIQYSAISIQDSFKNNYRYSLSTYFRDYSQEYGSIQKLVGFEGYLLVIFEHAIGIAVINERILSGQSDGEPVFINTNNVLPEELTIVTDTFGTQWPDSVVKSELGYVYGVDTIQKKIWRVKGQEIELISDFKVNKFLIDNITLGEYELSPIIGLKNVKTHYNNNKKDIMFTFYDDVYEDEEKVWNLCFNELLNEFVTFYSWVPSYSANIDTQYFSFDRNTAKKLSLLGMKNYSVPENYGVLVDNPKTDKDFTLYYAEKEHYYRTIKNPDGTTLDIKTKLTDGLNLLEDCTFRIEHDHWGNYNLITSDNETTPDDGKTFTFEKGTESGIYLFKVTPHLGDVYFKTETIVINYKNAPLTTDFYLHGNAGIFDVKENLRPTYWYDEQHPFEFEFVVNDKIGSQKIFNNLVIISNKAEPESFHFEIEGDNYDFSADKRTMYFRQEATKNLFQNLGLDVIYDRKFTDVMADEYTYEQYYRGDGNNPYNKTENKYSNYLTNERFNWDKAYPVENANLIRQVKSTIFPLYYERVDTYNEIYHRYKEMSGGTDYDFKNYSGSEIKWDRDQNQFNVVTHIKNSPIDKVGRMRGNSFYKEGKWNIQIPSITFMQKNETKNDWVTVNVNIKTTNILKYGSPLNYYKDVEIPPIVINSGNLPLSLNDSIVSDETLPNIYKGVEYISNVFGNDKWTGRKETYIRDKWIKIRIRYSGRNLAIIHSIITLYNISYS